MNASGLTRLSFKTSLGHCTSMYAAISPEYTYTNKLIVFNATFVLLVKGTCFIMCSVMVDRMWTLFYPNGVKAVHYSKAIRKVFDIRFVSIIVYRKMFLWRQCPRKERRCTTGYMYSIRHRATKLLTVIPHFMFAAIWPALTLCNLVTPVSLLYSCKKDSAWKSVPKQKLCPCFWCNC